MLLDLKVELDVEMVLEKTVRSAVENAALRVGIHDFEVLDVIADEVLDELGTVLLVNKN